MSSWDELSKLLPNRTRITIKNKAIKLKIRRLVGPAKWQLTEDDILKQNYANCQQAQLLKLLPNRNWIGITQRATSLGLRRNRNEDGRYVFNKSEYMTKQGQPVRYWTREEEEILAQNYDKKTNSELRELIPRHNLTSMQYKASQLGLSGVRFGQKATPLRMILSQADETPLPMTETEKAYLAGILDGEGSISLTLNYPKKRKGMILITPRVTIASTSQPLIDWLKLKLTDLGAYTLHKQGKDRRVCCLIIFSWRSLRLIKTIYPYLIIKKDRATLLFNFWDIRKTHLGKPYSKEEIEIALTLRSINIAGRNPLFRSKNGTVSIDDSVFKTYLERHEEPIPASSNKVEQLTTITSVKE
ncbi:MAG: hypothetical protein KGN01_07495 [Patescibacteria group bacterium]|nr:hypothetical protein [Patescibacteria group bacterium]